MEQHVVDQAAVDAILTAEGDWLVRLCARLSGDPGAAEDLAQETLLEAWRNRHKLSDPTGVDAWLAAIARNVCLRWGRRQGRDLAYRAIAPGDSIHPPVEQIEGEIDLEIELERGELADLLDRALALLPDETRQVLVERYVFESPHAEIAARLGLSEGAVAMRLQRGKIALRSVLARDLRDEAITFGLCHAQPETWRETRIWCHVCGRHRLSGRLEPDGNAFTLRCPNCCADPDSVVTNSQHVELFKGINGYKAALNRFMAWSHDYVQQALAEGGTRCWRCGYPTRVDLGTLDTATPIVRGNIGLQIICPNCGDIGDHTALSTMALYLPTGRRFWREHPRIRTLPIREVEADGRPALVTRHESLTNSAALDSIFERATYRLIDARQTAG